MGIVASWTWVSWSSDSGSLGEEPAQRLIFVQRVLGVFEERLLPFRGRVFLVLLVGALGRDGVAGSSRNGPSSAWPCGMSITPLTGSGFHRGRRRLLEVGATSTLGLSFGAWRLFLSIEHL